MLNNLTLDNERPRMKEFRDLRSSVNWDNPDETTLEKSIQNTLYWVCVWDSSKNCTNVDKSTSGDDKNKKLLGTARIIGDGAMYFYIQDVIVEPLSQGQGIGRLLMENIGTSD